jgi:hypothetical protein
MSVREELIEAIKSVARDYPKKVKKALEQTVGNGKSGK